MGSARINLTSISGASLSEFSRLEEAGTDGGHSGPRDLGRRGVRPHSHFQEADDGALAFSGDLPARLALAEAEFGQRIRVMLDAQKDGRG